MLLEHVIACGWFGVSSKPAKGGQCPVFFCGLGDGALQGNVTKHGIFTDTSGNFAGNLTQHLSSRTGKEDFLEVSILDVKWFECGLYSKKSLCQVFHVLCIYLLKHDKTELLFFLFVGNWWPRQKIIKHGNGKTLKRVHSRWRYQMMWSRG